MKFKVRDLVEGALFIALAAVLGIEMFEIPIGPEAHISLQFVPLVMIALRFNPFQTFILDGICFGLIDFFLDHTEEIAALPLDYLVALGAFCLVSFTRKQLFYYNNNTKSKFKQVFILTASLVVWTAIRLACQTIDGIFVYGVDFMGSLLYNLPNAGLDGLVTIAVTLLIYFPLRPLNVKKFREDRWGKIGKRD